MCVHESLAALPLLATATDGEDDREEGDGSNYHGSAQRQRPYGRLGQHHGCHAAAVLVGSTVGCRRQRSVDSRLWARRQHLREVLAFTHCRIVRFVELVLVLACHLRVEPRWFALVAAGADVGGVDLEGWVQAFCQGRTSQTEPGPVTTWQGRPCWKRTRV